MINVCKVYLISLVDVLKYRIFVFKWEFFKMGILYIQTNIYVYVIVAYSPKILSNIIVIGSFLKYIV